MSDKIKPILVVSHERSGTHFLLNSLAVNFNQTIKSFLPVSLPVKGNNYYSLFGDTEDYEKALVEFLKMAIESSHGTGREMFKSHHDIQFFQRGLEHLEKYNVIYMERECKDVITSLYYYFRDAGSVTFPKTGDMTLRDFALNIKPSEYPFDLNYSYVESSNFVERWKYHREGWVNSDIPVLKTSFEDLFNSHDETMSSIADLLGLKKPNNWYRPSVGEFVNVEARKGIIGDWENLFDGEEDLVAEIDAIVDDPENTRSKDGGAD